MQTLGYKPYHMYEVVFAHGQPHMKALTEAISAQANGFSAIKRYEKEDFDKLLTGYDVSGEDDEEECPRTPDSAGRFC